jgi:sortase (surface protein transpeptidase)
LSALLEGADGSAGSSGRRARAEARAGRAWGRLDLPRVGLSALVAEGVGEGTLAVAVATSPTARFRESGNVALAGHRDTVFQMMKDIWPEDVSAVDHAGRKLRYRVEWLAIVDLRAPSSRIDRRVAADTRDLLPVRVRGQCAPALRGARPIALD